MATAEEVEAAAADFARHTRGGEGWALALIVACCVTPGTAGRPSKNRRDHDDSKVSARTFARMAGTSTDRVLRYLQAWEKAASKKGGSLVSPAENFVPEDWDNAEYIPEGVDFFQFYDATATPVGRNLSDPNRRTALQNAARDAGIGAAKVLDVASNPRAVATAIAADPALAAAVAAHSDAEAAVRREGGKQTKEWADDLKKKKKKADEERMERDMKDGLDPTDSLSGRFSEFKDGLEFAFMLGNIAADLRKAVEVFQRDGFNLTHRDEVRLHAPKIRAALEDLEVFVETGDVDDEAEQLLGDTGS